MYSRLSPIPLILEWVSDGPILSVPAPILASGYFSIWHTASEWRKDDRGLLWIQGKPGSGKSTLMESILRDWEQRSSSIQISFFFHRRGTPLQKSPLGIFRSILHQLLTKVPTVRVKFQSTFEERTGSDGAVGKDCQWHEAEIWDFSTEAAIQAAEKHGLCIFIDAVDEARNETDNDGRTIEELRMELERVPEELAAVYEHILTQVISQDSRAETQLHQLREWHS